MLSGQLKKFFTQSASETATTKAEGTDQDIQDIQRADLQLEEAEVLGREPEGAGDDVRLADLQAERPNHHEQPDYQLTIPNEVLFERRCQCPRKPMMLFKY